MKHLEQNIDISHLSNFKTPARARYYFELHSQESLEVLVDIYKYASENSLPVLLVSGGTNMLFAFDVYEGIVILNNIRGWSYDQDTKQLICYGAEKIWDIAKDLEEKYNNNLWHRFIGLPGSVAGAIYGNAGCFWLETENNFVSCEVLDIESGQILKMSKKEMDFAYRNSRLKKEKKYFLISASFDLSVKKEKYSSDVDNIDFRENKQPKGNSCGSFFKNPNKEQSAWYLIESVWLKGKKIGWAYFSEKHANFLMNDGSGSWKDVIELIHLAQEKVAKEFWIQLENEVQIITNSEI